jgi:kinesin family protein 18/19
MQELFERINEVAEEKVTEVTLSYLEIYNETIRDLLVEGGSKQPLMLREDANQTVSVAGLSSHRPQNVSAPIMWQNARSPCQVEEVMDIIVRGNEYRTMSPTEANATSSRSHAVLQINVASKDRNASVNEPHTMATLSIIDLAGSERASATKNRGERLTEGANINKSLLALGSCINALCDPRIRNHVPYRNSKLTRLLKFSLGGNCKTVMIVCVSPSSVHYDETQNTLRYANRAKNIQTKVTKNVFNVNRHVKDYLKKIDEQRQLIDELMKKQKDYEGGAMIKFQKQGEKKEAIIRDAIVRLRNAYDECSQERRERLVTMRTLKQAEKRISLISAWIAAFDNVNETRENEELPAALEAMRKEAVGVSVELEQTRQHCHRKIERTYWTTKLDTAHQVGLRQLAEVDSTPDSNDAANITREYELLKSVADREAYTVMLEQEKGGETALVQVLVQAHIETITILNQITRMNEEEAVQAARNVLAKIMNSCTNATSQAIRPDSGLPVTEYFAPTTKGTPKRRKPVHLMDPSPMRPINFAPVADSSHLAPSPMKASPRRRKLVGVKKGIQFTPKKKSPSKGKRAVRWRDDTENGTLAEFQKTPEQFAGPSPTKASVELAPPALPSMIPVPEYNGSSPIPSPPQTLHDIKPRSSRFQTGFLTKKSDGSPAPPVMTTFSSDSERSPLSPLRENGTNTQRLSSLSIVDDANASFDGAQGGHSSSSDDEKYRPSSSDARQIGTAMKRRSSTNQGSATGPNRTHRRRSPTAASMAGSPPNENAMFSAGAARRMVKSERDGDWKTSVLSPRTAPVLKGALRRTTMAADERAAGSTLNRGPIRITSGPRGSLMPSKGTWR